MFLLLDGIINFVGVVYRKVIRWGRGGEGRGRSVSKVVRLVVKLMTIYHLHKKRVPQ